MKQLVKHFLRTNEEMILEKSLINCHVMGLYSIMLSDVPENRIRLYIAEPECELIGVSPGMDRFPLGVHPHHCDITLHCVYGGIINHNFKEEDDTPIFSVTSLDRYLYQSQISTGTMGFTLDKTNVTLNYTGANILTQDDSVFLNARDLHTVQTVATMLYSAWFVYEGKEDIDYIPYCYSNQYLNVPTNKKLYQKFQDIRNIMEILSKVRLY